MSWIKRNPRAAGLLLWLCVMAGILLLDAAIGSIFTLSNHLSDVRGTGRFLLLLIGASMAIRIMARSPLPLAHFGLDADPEWRKRFLLALLIGVAIPVVLYFLAFQVGAFRLVAPRSLPRYISTGLTAPVAGILAAYLQEIIYRGYVGTELFERFKVFGLVAAALFYALTFGFDASTWQEPYYTVKTIFAMFLVGITLHLARIYHGNLVVPIGLVGGWLIVDIIQKKAPVVILKSTHAEFSRFIAPSDDIRHSVLLWIVLVGAIIFYLVRLKRRPGISSAVDQPACRESRAAHGKSFFKSLVQFNPVSNLCVLASIDIWLRVLWQARFRVHPAYLPRLLFILLASTANSIINFPERVLLPLFLRNKTIEDPVIILGVHRSGTTFLHDILALDPQFIAPRGYQVFNPTGFLGFGRITHLLAGALLPWKRPFDSVEISLDTTNEDEFAIALDTHCSPYWSFSFPRERRHFDRFIYPDQMTARERDKWKQALSIFLKKLVLFKSGKPLLKSPYHTARIEILTELYPTAKFIHIHRNPLDVYQSSVLIEQDFIPLFQLQFAKSGEQFTDRLLAENYLRIEDAYEEQSKALSPSQIAETRYSDFTARTIVEVKRIYGEIGLEFSEEFGRNIENYLSSRPHYRRNKHEKLGDEEKQDIQQKLRPLFDRRGYEID